jgi:glucose/arabinose dehydrogenase
LSTAPLRLRRAAAACILAVAVASTVHAAQPVLVVPSGLQQPLFLTAPAGDSRLFIVERAGRIRLVQGGSLRQQPFLDLTAKVDTEREGGMTGLAFAPDFAQSGRFFVYYQKGDPILEDREMESVVSSFQVIGPPASATQADPASETVLFSLTQPHTIHNGGTIAIRDGWLYLALGDGGGAPPQEDGSYDPDDEAQRDGVPFGKMLRLDLSIANPDTQDWQVWAKGFRNPFRFSFDRLNGDLYLGDVGQDSREEIDYQPANATAGGNFGWDVLEGTLCVVDHDANGADFSEPSCGDPSLVPPIHEYEHAGACNAVTGGFVYRGNRVPSLYGRYLFADFCLDRIWSLRRDAQLGWVREDLTAELMPSPPLGGIAGFGEDGHGELYLMGLYDSRVYRVPEPGVAWAALAVVLALAASRGGRP